MPPVITPGTAQRTPSVEAARSMAALAATTAASARTAVAASRGPAPFGVHSGRLADSSGDAPRGLAGTECASGLIGQRDGDKPRLQPGPGARLGREYKPAEVLAAAEGAQLDLLRGQARQFNVPPGPAHCHGPFRLQARRVAEQSSVLEARPFQIQQAGELLLPVPARVPGVHVGRGGSRNGSSPAVSTRTCCTCSSP
jgi:hypothetical protein